MFIKLGPAIKNLSGSKIPNNMIFFPYITKQEYNAQVGTQTEFALTLGGSSPIIISLGDAIQILSVLQTDQEKGHLIRKLIIKIEISPCTYGIKLLKVAEGC